MGSNPTLSAITHNERLNVYKFLEDIEGEDGKGGEPFFEVFFNGDCLAGDIVLKPDGQKVWRPWDKYDDGLNKGQLEKIFEDFNKFLNLRHMEDKNPYLW